MERKLNTNGYYLGKYTAKTISGNIATVFYLLIFNRFHNAVYQEIDDFPEWKKTNSTEDLKAFIEEFGKKNDIEMVSGVSKVELNQNEISIKFFQEYDELNMEDKEFIEFKGVLLENGMNLSLHEYFFNEALQTYSSHKILDSFYFDFFETV